jgi:hypothetical protein
VGDPLVRASRACDPRAEEETMKRLATAVFISLLAMALLAPASAGATVKQRFWQDLSLSGPFAGRITLAIAFEDTKGNRLFKPRYASAYDLDARTSCDAPGDPWRSLGANAYSKYLYFRGSLDGGRFDHRFENEWESTQTAPVHGGLSGKLAWRGKWVKRVTGYFDVSDWDIWPATDSNCITSGTYSATRCKPQRSERNRPEWWRKWKVPVCRDYPM